MSLVRTYGQRIDDRGGEEEGGGVEVGWVGGDTLRVKASLRAPSSKMSVVSEGFAGKQGGSFSGGSEETY